MAVGTPPVPPPEIRRRHYLGWLTHAAAAASAAEAEYVLKKTENPILLSVSELGPSTNGKVEFAA